MNKSQSKEGREIKINFEEANTTAFGGLALAERLAGRLGLWSHLFNCGAFIHAAGACDKPCPYFSRLLPFFIFQRTLLFFLLF